MCATRRAGNASILGTVGVAATVPVVAEASAQLFDEPSIAPPPIDVGARYWRCDLQIHTPRDQRWPGEEPRGQDQRRELARKYLAAAQSRGVEVVGVTEHHDVSWIDELRYAARGLGMHVVPGFEVETSEGIHVLCLFDPGRPVLELEDVLTSLGLDRNRRSKSKATEIRSEFPLADVLGTVQDRYDGICIAAHVTSRKGILDLPPGGHVRTHGSSLPCSRRRSLAPWPMCQTRACATCSRTRTRRTGESAGWRTC
jgi:hypothetical protein